MRRPLLAALVVALVAVIVVPIASAATGEDVQPSAVLSDPSYRPQIVATGSVLPAGVRIAGVDVGGLRVDTAVEFVRASFAQPLTIVLAGKRIKVSPTDLGAVAYAKSSVQRALALSTGREVELQVRVSSAGVRAFVDSLARQYDRAVVPRRFAMLNFRPSLTKGVVGRQVDRPFAVTAIVSALTAGERSAVVLPVKVTVPPVPSVADSSLIVIRRRSNTLELFNGVKLVHRFGVATGQAAYPTPLGTFKVITKQRNPTWYPPASPWARGEKPVGPGPGNPLGTRWMGLSAPLVGIHGTPDAASIGYSRSHGCIRMRISQAEWLFDHVDVGTTVMIVNA